MDENALDTIDTALAEISQCVLAVEQQSADDAARITLLIRSSVDEWLYHRLTPESLMAKELEQLCTVIESEPDASERFPRWGLALRYVQQRARRDFESSTDQPYPLEDLPGIDSDEQDD